MIYKPSFKVLEVNNLAGLRIGHVLAQQPAADGIAKVTAFGDNYIENGIIVGLGKTGEIENYDKTKHAMPFVHYTEEIITHLVGLDSFAVEIPEGEKAYPRCIGLYVGDAFTTNNVVKGAVDDNKLCYGKVVDGVINLEAAESADSMFIVNKTTMPAGGVGYECTYYKPAKAE